MHGTLPDHIIRFMNDVSLYDFIVTMVFIISVIIFISSKLYKILERYRKSINEFEDHNSDIKKHNKDIAKLKMDNQTLHNDINNLSNNIKNIEKMIQEMQIKNDERERARLKNEISKAYQRFHKTRKWSSMEKEAMEDLIEQYEDCGGLNSFVHKKVQVEMYTWEVTDEITE